MARVSVWKVMMLPSRKMIAVHVKETATNYTRKVKKCMYKTVGVMICVCVFQRNVFFLIVGCLFPSKRDSGPHVKLQQCTQDLLCEITK